MRYLIFGGTGSLGRKLIDRFIDESDVAVYSRDEAKHWTIRNELSHKLTDKQLSKLKFFVGDIRDRDRITSVIRQYDPTHIIIAAALKQVDTCELSPSESISTNLLGTQNVINAVNESNSKKLQVVLFVSTDKACSPVNVYGMCKALSERTVTSQSLTGRSDVRYIAVRYGNVLESRGSIIPLFKYQAENAKCLTVTDPNMTRFVMTLDDSVSLIKTAIERSENGMTWIPRLPAMRIGDLAEIFANYSSKQIQIIGLRPGEKQHEDLINESESVRTHQFENFYIIKPAYMVGDGQRFTYTSNDSVMTKDELYKYLMKLGIIDKPLNEFKGSSIEEIVTYRQK